MIEGDIPLMVLNGLKKPVENKRGDTEQASPH